MGHFPPGTWVAYYEAGMGGWSSKIWVNDNLLISYSQMNLGIWASTY